MKNNKRGMSNIKTAILLISDKKSNETPPLTKESSDVTANVPKIIESTNDSSQPAEKENATPSDLVEDVGSDRQKPNNDDKNKEPAAKEPDKPVRPKEPEQPKQPDNDGLNIGGGSKPDKYSCGAANHHCESEQAHAWLKNQELEGCKHCGSHSCPSFYTLNEWGFTEGDPKQCPKYNGKNDPQKYCQRCGRQMWSKDNPTECFSYLQPTDCECGQHVEGNTCHHH